MYRTANSNRTIGLAVTTAMASALLAGCASNAAPPASISASKAEAALAVGKHESAISHAEAAVLADPRNPGYRSTLGAAYLDAGRFQAASTSFDDAMELGDTSARTSLSLALALTADGKNAEAVAVLNEAQNKIAPSDLGLAYALAGQPQRGIHILTNALRGGENTPKVRQNLAYSYALNGQWRDARLMVAEDVPADKVPDRISEWAQTITPSEHRNRIAKLLGVPAHSVDPGQPVLLALSNFPAAEQLAAHALPEAAPAPAASPVAQVAQAPRQAELQPAARQANAGQFDQAFSAPQQTTQARVAQSPSQRAGGVRFVSNPVVQPVPASAQRQAAQRQQASSQAARQGQPAVAQAIANADGSHLVQLGSFSNERNAQRAWNIYVQRYPELANHQMVITEAEVRGKRYFRVSAAGYDAGQAASMCGRVKRSGEGCFAWADGKPMPGAVDTGRRFASR
jgi:Flp pilus assembly protein TadD